MGIKILQIKTSSYFQNLKHCMVVYTFIFPTVEIFQSVHHQKPNTDCVKLYKIVISTLLMFTHVINYYSNV